jgi:hypothetical protein
VGTSFSESALNGSERSYFFHFLLRRDLIRQRFAGLEFPVSL